jgi:hypothetical protein
VPVQAVSHSVDILGVYLRESAYDIKVLLLEEFLGGKSKGEVFQRRIESKHGYPMEGNAWVRW